MNQPLVIANWKMNLDLEGVRRWCQAFESSWGTLPVGAQVVVCPSFVHMLFLSGRLLEIGFFLGAQDCAPQENGAYTGDVSAAMLKDAGCTYVIVGHSERRLQHGEKDAVIHEKMQQVFAQKMIPILCVGETLEERQEGLTQKVLTKQMHKGLPKSAGQPCVIAYEPVWAIGTGNVPQPIEIEKAHRVIAELLEEMGYPPQTPILYGGSVAPSNARALFDVPGVDGFLVGGASLDGNHFQKIIDSCPKKPPLQEAQDVLSSRISERF